MHGFEEYHRSNIPRGRCCTVVPGFSSRMRLPEGSGSFGAGIINQSSSMWDSCVGYNSKSRIENGFRMQRYGKAAYMLYCYVANSPWRDTWKVNNE